MIRDLGVLGGGSVQFSPDGQYVSGITGNTISELSIRLVEIPTGNQVLKSSIKHDDAVTGVQVKRINGYAAAVTTSRDHTAKIWDVASGNLILQLTGHTGWVNSAQFSRDGKFIVTASGDNTAKIWDTVNGKVLMNFKHDKTINFAEFSPDEMYIVTASFDNTSKIWEVSTGKIVQELEGHKDIIYKARFSSDGRYVITASADKTARVWETATGKLITTITGHSKAVYSAAISRDGNCIVTASEDKTAKIWFSSVTPVLTPQYAVPMLSPPNLTVSSPTIQQQPNNTNISNQSQAGTIATNAKVLSFKTDYPMLGEFHDGFASLRDGELAALINEKGEMVHPYGKYSEFGIPANGYIPVNGTKKNGAYYINNWGILNYKGEIVVPLTITSRIESVSEDGFYNTDGYENKSISGSIFKLKAGYTKGDTSFAYTYGKYSEGLCSFSESSYPTSKIGFLNRKGEIVIKPQPYEGIDDFSEGLAAAGKKDEVGQIKYGFINTKGEVVIPFNLSNKPGPFKNGLSHVTSKNGEHAWIDRTGQFKFKMSDFPGWSVSRTTIGLSERVYCDFVNLVISVYSGSTKAWLDVNGKIVPSSVSYTSNEKGQIVNHPNPGFAIEKVTPGQMMITTGLRKGILDGEGNIIVPPVFNELGFFDPVSGLASATFDNGKEKIKGYINRDGVFVIIKGKSSEW